MTCQNKHGSVHYRLDGASASDPHNHSTRGVTGTVRNVGGVTGTVRSVGGVTVLSVRRGAASCSVESDESVNFGNDRLGVVRHHDTVPYAGLAVGVDVDRHLRTIRVVEVQCVVA